MAHEHSIYDTDPHFSINPITRALKNESSVKTSVIQYDHNSERFTFEIPRTVEGHDMSLCNKIEVHYINIEAGTKKQNANVYVVEDMQISPNGDDVVVFSWLVSQNATMLVGSLNFLIRFSCVAEDGTIEYAWNTAVYTGISVSSGIYNSEAIVEEYVDVLAQWEQALFSANEEGIENITTAKAEALESLETAKTSALDEIIAKGEETKKTIPEDYATLDGTVKKNANDIAALETTSRKLISNALKGSASGNPIRLDDVSPLEHEIKVNVNVNGATVKKYGKNLFDPSVLLQASGWVYENGYYCGKPSNLYNKYSKSSGNSLFDGFLPNTQYTLSFKGFNTSYEANGTLGLVFYYSDGTTTAEKIKADTEQTLSVTSNAGKTIVGLHAIYNMNEIAYLKDIQLEVGTTATEYEPYKEPTTYTADENGNVDGVTNIYPTTTLVADDGAVISAEYNRDINKAFEEIYQAIATMGAAVVTIPEEAPEA